MFKYFSDKTKEDLNMKKEEKDSAKIDKSLFGPQNEYFRVGATVDGMTTLTIISSNGFSSTLSLSHAACEQLIRMLRATYISEPDK